MAHSKALKPQDQNPKKLLAKIFFKLRYINTFGDNLMNWMRDKIYAPVLSFSLKNRILVVSIFFGGLILSIGSVGGGIIRTSFFPQIASDRVTINLQMPNGTNENITDSIINTIERKAKQVNQEFTNEFLSNTDKILFQNIVKNIGPGSSKGSLIINLLPGENRPTNLSSAIVANRIQELVGDVIGVESLVFGSGGNFGGSPVSVSLLGNNIQELKAAKKRAPNNFRKQH